MFLTAYRFYKMSALLNGLLCNLSACLCSTPPQSRTIRTSFSCASPALLSLIYRYGHSIALRINGAIQQYKHRQACLLTIAQCNTVHIERQKCTHCYSHIERSFLLMGPGSLHNACRISTTLLVAGSRHCLSLLHFTFFVVWMLERFHAEERTDTPPRKYIISHKGHS